MHSWDVIIQLFFLAFFTLLVVGKTLYLKWARHINAIALGHSSNGGIVEILIFSTALVWVLILLSDLLSLVDFFPKFLIGGFVRGPGMFPIGLAMILFGFALFTLALIQLGNSWRLGIDDKDPGELVTKGIFAFTRNPIYLFFLFYFLGTFCLRGSAIYLLFFSFMAFMLHLQILREEKYLLRMHGIVYVEYCKNTGRYWTWSFYPFLLLVRRKSSF